MLQSLLLILSLFLAGPDAPVVEWQSELSHDFGKIKYEVPATVEFFYKNISDQPLSIDNVRPGCGCTSPDWEDVVIQPGETGKITIEYDALKMGYFKQKIRVYFSAQRRAELLYIEGTVVEK
ncbi:MAG: DUF1573 domain-containing protein [Phaeodactylibacter sp.]|nr:DUF1573 domain-containing protein [Phaeodactylibacter sp.]